MKNILLFLLLSCPFVISAESFENTDEPTITEVQEISKEEKIKQVLAMVTKLLRENAELKEENKQLQNTIECLRLDFKALNRRVDEIINCEK